MFSGNGSTCDDGTPNGGLRIVGGQSELEGRVEICLDETWGTICDNFWSNLDAAVVCFQLGLGRSDATAFQESRFGAGTGPIYLDRFFCRGSETSITNCGHTNARDCEQEGVAGVRCSGK